MKLAGHVLQATGYALVFLGLAVVATGLFVSGSYPGVPFWQFVVGSAAVGVPLMIAGGRIDSWGRGLVLGQSPGAAARRYRASVMVTAAYLALLWLQGALVAAPMFVRATGLVYLSDAFVSTWLFTSVLVLCTGRYWVTRPLMRAIEQRVMSRG